jgi:SAM-dependent methyltransferase
MTDSDPRQKPGRAMGRENYVEANRQAWDEAGPVHARSQWEDLERRFREPAYSCLDAVATSALRRIGIEGKAVAQLCCNNGRELLSIRNLGAGRCVGFDVSEAFVGQARRLAEIAGLDCSFVAGSVYDIPAEYDGRFDLAVVTIGTLGWLPDLAGFFAVAARLLRAGGTLFIHEQHPIMSMFEPWEAEDPLRLRYSYFREEPFRDEEGLDYWTGARYASKPMYWFHHKLSDIIGGCLAKGLEITSFEEHGHALHDGFAAVERQAIRPPIGYMLTARKRS